MIRGVKMKENRQSNIELYRIIVMFFIVAHHYVVNSGLMDKMLIDSLNIKSFYLLVFGAWGKTGINCFVLITGYYMCKLSITIKKWLKLLCEIEFYNIIIYLIFVVSKYEMFNLNGLLRAIIPVNDIASGFVSCYLVFYLFIPFLNILINSMNEKHHITLLALCLVLYTIWGSNPYITIVFNYVSWFMIIYLIGAYVRLYPKKIYNNTKMWLISTISCIILAVVSIYLLSARGGYPYFFVADSNKIFAILISVSSFILFLNLPIKYNKYINLIAKSTFGVLLIHANSDAMRNWLWKDTLQNVEMYTTTNIYIHSIISVIAVFGICTMIDIARIRIVDLCILNFEYHPIETNHNSAGFR